MHIHFKLRLYAGSTKRYEFTSQFFFDDTLTDTIHAESPYNQKGQQNVRNGDDGIYNGLSTSEKKVLTLAATNDGGLYSGVISLAVSIGQAHDLVESGVRELRVRNPEHGQAVRLSADDPRAVDAGGLIALDSRGQDRSNAYRLKRDHSERAQIIAGRQIDDRCGLGNLLGIVDARRRNVVIQWRG